MSKPKAVFLDLDDCVVNFVTHLCNIHYKLYGEKFNRSDITEWKLPKELYKTFKDYESWLYISQPMLPKAKAKIQEIRDSGYKVVFITARGEDFKKHTEFSLALHEVKYDADIIFRKNKALQINRLSEQYNIVAFADNKPSTVRKVATETDVRNVYLIGLPWNRDEEMPDNVKRINSISDINIGDLK